MRSVHILSYAGGAGEARSADYNRNCARRAHLLKLSAVSRQPSAETEAERASDSLTVS